MLVGSSGSMVLNTGRYQSVVLMGLMLNRYIYYLLLLSSSNKNAISLFTATVYKCYLQHPEQKLFLFPSLILAYLSVAEPILLSKDVVKQVFEKCGGEKSQSVQSPWQCNLKISQVRVQASSIWMARGRRNVAHCSSLQT